MEDSSKTSDYPPRRFATGPTPAEVEAHAAALAAAPIITEGDPFDYLRVGEVWGEQADHRVRVHRVDPAGNRAQFKMAEGAGRGMRYNLTRALKPGQEVKIRRHTPEAKVAMRATILSVQQERVTLGGFEFCAFEEAVE